ncbi:uncharacterized protein LOC124282811 isoform X1 [Haliotis rubra]|uniref:uncharacterized protein LOC124282811 isoform X1 n=1 Tax=Haliotis rubra TaxID=36100 RepID=UPI001EE574AB|nr:uncharacterized protein LOC124282811 isoform X1 [Haliotis rubra]
MASRPTPDSGVSGGSRETLISNAKVMLYHSWSFLADYLPLANSQASDFIVKNLWSLYVPQNIQEELLKMSDDELSSFPSGMLGEVMSECYGKEDKGEMFNAEQAKANIKSEEKWESFDPGEHRLEFIKCQFLENSSVSAKGKKSVHLQTCPISWKHSNLYAFTQAAQKHTLTSMDVLTAVGEVVSVQSHAVQDDDDVDGAADNDEVDCVLMSQKKSHEVEVMAEVCARMADAFKTNLTVDLGSGKGYLSTQLCYKFNHHVIGIDSSCTNTEGATKRAGRLDKKWSVRKNQPVKQMKSSQKDKNHPSDTLPETSTTNDFESSSFVSKCSSCDVDKLSDNFTTFNVHDEDVAMLHAETADIKYSNQIAHDDDSSTRLTGYFENYKNQEK